MTRRARRLPASVLVAVAVGVLVVVVGLVAWRSARGVAAEGAGPGAPENTRRASQPRDNAASARQTGEIATADATAADVAEATESPDASGGVDDAAAPIAPPWIATLTIDATDDLGARVADAPVEVIFVDDHEKAEDRYSGKQPTIIASGTATTGAPATLDLPRWPARVAIAGRAEAVSLPSFYIVLGDETTTAGLVSLSVTVSHHDPRREDNADWLRLRSQRDKAFYMLGVVNASLVAEPRVTPPPPEDGEDEVREEEDDASARRTTTSDRLDIRLTLRGIRHGSAELVLENLNALSDEESEALALLVDAPEEVVGARTIQDGERFPKECDLGPLLPLTDHGGPPISFIVERGNTASTVAPVVEGARLRWPQLAAGTYTLRAQTTWGREAALTDIVVCPGQMLVQSARLVPRPTLLVTVLDGDHDPPTPIEGAVVTLEVQRLGESGFSHALGSWAGRVTENGSETTQSTDRHGTALFHAIGPTLARVWVAHEGYAGRAATLSVRAGIVSERVLLGREKAHVTVIATTPDGGPAPDLNLQMDLLGRRKRDRLDVIGGRAEGDFDLGVWQLYAHMRDVGGVPYRGVSAGTVDLSTPGDHTVRLVIPTLVPVEFRVRRRGVAVSDQTIWVQNDGRKMPDRVLETPRTGDDGTAAAMLREGAYLVRVAGITRSIEVVRGAPNVFTIEMAGPAVSGIVVDDETGAPLDKAFLALRHEMDASRQRWDASDVDFRQLPGAMTTGTDGSFRIEPLEPGRYLLGVSRENYAHATLAVELAEEENAPLTVRLSAHGGRIRGSIRGEDGAPITSAQIVTILREWNDRLVPLQAHWSGQGETDEYTTDLLPEGSYRIVFDAHHFWLDGTMYQPTMTESIAVRTGETARHDVVMEAAGGVRVRVVDTSGVPVAGAVMNHRYEDADDGAYTPFFPLVTAPVTDQGGHFSSTNMKPGPVSLSASTAGPNYRLGRSAVVEIRPHEWTDVTIEVSPYSPSSWVADSPAP